MFKGNGDIKSNAKFEVSSFLTFLIQQYFSAVFFQPKNDHNGKENSGFQILFHVQNLNTLHFVMLNMGMDILLCTLNAYSTNKYGKMGHNYNTNHLSNSLCNSSMHFPLVSHLIYKTFATNESGKKESS